MACCRLVFCGLAVMSGPEVGSTFGVLVLREVAVISVAIRDFLDLVSFFTQDNKLLLRPFGGPLGLIKARKSLAMIRDPARRQSFEALGSHDCETTLKSRLCQRLAGSRFSDLVG